MRYYVYLKKSIRGPFYPRDIVTQPGFSRSSLVCQEKNLGQWHEASFEPVFQALLEVPGQALGRPRPPLTMEIVEETASRTLLEKAINKNIQLERDVKDLRKTYNIEKHNFDEALKKKDAELRVLAEKLKRTIDNAQAAKGEHPSWESLYKTLKKRSEEKIAEATQALAEKMSEMVRLRERIQETAENGRAELRKAEEIHARETSACRKEMHELRSQAEEKEMLARTYSDNIASLVGKNEEFQSIMFDERRDYEEQSKKYCEEIGRLRADLKWRDQETAKVREELFDAVNRLNEFEAVDHLKSREQQELYGALSTKLKLLSGYFENLEARVKLAFKKA